ncbi:2OG-Fe(II) oxygenase family protein [Streptomyces sp. BK205]|uniref:isopenicillin N synthase family dioxygenase n=1 Tax=Streptomyces sp. BK205 TaxID=2512164 RepID=UPI001048F5C3|nr:2OG-Fe(II) oxygenase family protein [Streptomyces sp. BK205]TCR16041.1 isopenicillin N synthase-like dioxygenase [Streptomyces sp. BK205]
MLARFIFMNVAAEQTIDMIDMSEWRKNADQATAIQLVDSFQRTGFAYITGHGVPAATVADVLEASRQFFAQDAARLDAVHYRHAGHYHGYVPKGVIPGTGSFHEIYDTGMDIPTDYEGPGAFMRAIPNLWPENLPEFRPAIERYQLAMRELCDEVLCAISVGLELPADFFKVRCAEPHAQMRLLHYVPRPDAPDDALSVGRHSDYEAVTILAQDDVGGLQIRDPEGEWINVPPIEGAFVINAGDMLTRWSNGRIPATPHRVLTPKEQERFSVAFFYGTSYDVLIEPIGEPVNEKARQYEPITTGAYMEKRFTEDGI